jgi:hypothetical protein
MKESNEFHRNALLALEAARVAVDVRTRQEWLGIADNWIALADAYANVRATSPAVTEPILRAQSAPGSSR